MMILPSILKIKLKEQWSDYFNVQEHEEVVDNLVVVEEPDRYDNPYEGYEYLFKDRLKADK